MKRTKISKQKKIKRIQDKITKPKVQEKFILSLSGSNSDKAQLITKSNLWNSAASDNKVKKFSFFTKGDSKTIRYWMTPKLLIMYLNIPNPPIKENYFISHKFYTDKYVSFYLNPAACSNMIYFMDKVNDVLAKNEFFDRIILLTDNRYLDSLLYEIINKSSVNDQLQSLDLSIAVPCSLDQPDQIKSNADISSDHQKNSKKKIKLFYTDEELDYSSTQKSQNQINVTLNGQLDNSESYPSLIISSPSSSDSKNNPIFKEASKTKDIYLQSTSQDSTVSISSSFRSSRNHRSTSVRPRQRETDDNSRKKTNKTNMSSANSTESRTKRNNRNSISNSSRNRRNISVSHKERYRNSTSIINNRTDGETRDNFERSGSRNSSRSNRNSQNITSNSGGRNSQNSIRNNRNSISNRNDENSSSRSSSRYRNRTQEDEEPETRYSMDSNGSRSRNCQTRNNAKLEFENQEEEDFEGQYSTGNHSHRHHSHHRHHHQHHQNTFNSSGHRSRSSNRDDHEDNKYYYYDYEEEENDNKHASGNSRNGPKINRNSINSKNTEGRSSRSSNRSQSRNRNNSDIEYEYYEEDEIDTRYSMDNSGRKRKRRTRKNRSRNQTQNDEEPETKYSMDSNGSQGRNRNNLIRSGNRNNNEDEKENDSELQYSMDNSTSQKQQMKRNRNSISSISSNGSQHKKISRSSSVTQKETHEPLNSPHLAQSVSSRPTLKTIKPHRRSQSITSRTTKNALNRTAISSNSPKRSSLYNSHGGRHAVFASDHVRYNFDCSSLISNSAKPMNSDNPAKRKKLSTDKKHSPLLNKSKNNDENSSSTDNFVFDIEGDDEDTFNTNAFDSRPNKNTNLDKNDTDKKEDDSVKEISVLKIVSDGTSSITKTAPKLKTDNGNRKLNIVHFSDTEKGKKRRNKLSSTHKVIRKNHSDFTEMTRTTKIINNDDRKFSIDSFDNLNLAFSNTLNKSKFLNESTTTDKRAINSDDTSSEDELILDYQDKSKQNEIVNVSDSIDAALPSVEINPKQNTK